MQQTSQKLLQKLKIPFSKRKNDEILSKKEDEILSKKEDEILFKKEDQILSKKEGEILFKKEDQILSKKDEILLKKKDEILSKKENCQVVLKKEECELPSLKKKKVTEDVAQRTKEMPIIREIILSPFPQRPAPIIKNVQSSNQVFYAWLHDYDKSKKQAKEFIFTKQVEAGDCWENIRYLIEKKEGFQQKNSECYLEGYLQDSDIILPPKYHFLGDEKICIKRVMLPNGMKPFVPLKYRHVVNLPQMDETLSASPSFVFDQNMNEDAKIDVLCNASSVFENSKQSHLVPEKKKYIFAKNPDGTISKLGPSNQRAVYVHASDFMNGYISQKDVPLNFKCRRCFVIGQHWEDACPSWTDPNFKVNKLGRRKMPHGIMMYRLRQALPHEEHDAFEKADGTLWVYKDECKEIYDTK